MSLERIITLLSLGILACASCCRTQNGFSKEELALIHGADSIMHVLTIDDPAESLVLRATSSDISARSLLSEDYRRLCSLMVATVTHPSQDGVGIAGPQVGLNRRIVAVQRFDKEGFPFEVYPNIRIVWKSDSLAFGSEGCLSVPGRSGNVLRSREIVIEYALPSADGLRSEGDLRGAPSASGKKLCRPFRSDCQTHVMVRDTVSGFTAVIFQHECDHLDGILYIDRLQ